MSINFSIVEKEVRIVNPLRNFSVDSWKIQYRVDPLTGRISTVIPKLYSYRIKLLKSEESSLRKVIMESRSKCPFCPENIGKTPTIL